MNKRKKHDWQIRMKLNKLQLLCVCFFLFGGIVIDSRSNIRLNIYLDHVTCNGKKQPYTINFMVETSERNLWIYDLEERSKNI